MFFLHPLHFSVVLRIRSLFFVYFDRSYVTS